MTIGDHIDTSKPQIRELNDRIIVVLCQQLGSCTGYLGLIRTISETFDGFAGTLRRR